MLSHYRVFVLQVPASFIKRCEGFCTMFPMRVMQFQLVMVASTAIALPTPSPLEAVRFVGIVKAEWLAEDRATRVLEDFGFVDPAGNGWAAEGIQINGTSSPGFGHLSH